MVLIGPYLLAKAYVAVTDTVGGMMGSVPVRCYNQDLKQSGWQPEQRLAPALRLNPEWADRDAGS